MKLTHLISTLAIVACTTLAWFILAFALSLRSGESSTAMNREVAGVWGPAIVQQHPAGWFETPNAPGGRATVLPSASDISVSLKSDPKRRGLVWHRTYDADFKATYVFTNPTPIPQTLHVAFPLPPESAGLQGFVFRLDGDSSTTSIVPGSGGAVTRAVLLPPSGSVKLETAYRTRGTDTWRYLFPDKRRITGFTLTMRTGFDEINFPVGTGSPGPRKEIAGGGRELRWEYPDVLGAPDIGMDMPKRLNAGPVAARIAFFAPVSLLFFITVVLLTSGMRGIALHPMHVFFVAAGFFAFHLLFAYLVDLMPLAAGFTIATACSLALVCGYLRAVGGTALFRIALPAQALYLVAFSASFFIDGLTGITLAVLGVLTLALLMILTAGTDWRQFFSRKPPPLPEPQPQALPAR